MSFKKLVEAIAAGASEAEICGLIAQSFQAEKITWKEHETLYDLLNLIYKN